MYDDASLHHLHPLINCWHLIKSKKQQDKAPEKDDGDTSAALGYSKEAKMLVTFSSKRYIENIVWASIKTTLESGIDIANLSQFSFLWFSM